MVCTPSENENERGVTVVNDMFAGRGLENSTDPVTISLVVYGAFTVVNGFPVYT